ncbi:hypothetical protein PVAP13_1KG419700 [Panicum virgatum]|uniref:Uncharacterized protein n=1 Tax=Panicum virgatum TaxID=38727 RepID=A0A8T0XMT5_PANVG|nr:hypothetical protein PVAP13_1KG419700 [Panicum virgatum]
MLELNCFFFLCRLNRSDTLLAYYTEFSVLYFLLKITPVLQIETGVTISFVLAGAACVLNALCYAELASRFPAVVGGAYLYTYAAFNEITAFLVFTQLMVDYHIGAASIARSLASYFIQFLELIPFLKGHIPSWIGHGEEFFGGVVSINILAPILLILLTAILCYGVKESSAVNTFMTTLKIVIVIVVVFAGVFEVDVSNWSPFMPNGFKSVVTGATVVFFAYVGFDAVANSAEEAKRPQRDLPIGILGSLLACVLLYVAVCLVITGMVPYTLLGEDAPLAEAFAAKGLKFVTVLISIGAVVGLTTTLLVGLYVQVYLLIYYVSLIRIVLLLIKLIYLMNIASSIILNSHVCILALEGMGFYLQYLLEYTQQGILLCTLRSGLAVLRQSWQVSLMCTCSHIFFPLARWYGNFSKYFHYNISFLPFISHINISLFNPSKFYLSGSRPVIQLYQLV